MADLTKKVNLPKLPKTKRIKNFPEMVAMATDGVDEIVGPDGTKLVSQFSRHMKRIVAGLKAVRKVSVRIFKPGTGPAVTRFFPGSKALPRFIRRIEKGVDPLKSMTFRTRQTGGIQEAIGWLTKKRAAVVELGGFVFPFPGGASKFRNAGNDFSGELKDAGKKAIGKWRLRRKNPVTGKMEVYEKAHLWGFIFGDEARDGIMYAPREFNQFWQSKRVEKWIEGLGKDVRALKGNLALRARAESFTPGEISAAAKKSGSEVGERARAGDGEYLLKRVTYELMMESPQKPGELQKFGELVFDIPPPWDRKSPLKMPNSDDLPGFPRDFF